MFLGRFQNKKRLGSGGFGKIHLVTDQNQQQFALKLIPIEKLMANDYMVEYLDGEIECMKNLDSPYILKIHQNHWDEDYVYMILDYCSGGDLANFQKKICGGVFNLEKAVQVLVDVLKGLECLHGQGYFHRDIKPENILVSSNNGKEIFKLADFGFTKQVKDARATNLGTDEYKAPQVFWEKDYGFEVDMWSFGVLFYTLLNKELPFKLLQGNQTEKGLKLAKMAESFSYKQSVQDTKLRKMENCTPDMEDLFSRIFEVDQAKRMTFIELREHPVFKKHFPVIEQCSFLVYNKTVTCFKNNRTFQNLEGNFTIIPFRRSNSKDGLKKVLKNGLKKIEKEDLEEEKNILRRSKDQIDFLADTISLVSADMGLFNRHEVLMLNYNLLKYYIIMLRRFSEDFNVNSLLKRYPNKKWKQYTSSKHFKNLSGEIVDDMINREIQFRWLCEECKKCLPQIGTINKHFQKAFDFSIKEGEFDGDFKSSYRASTSYMYSAIRKALKAGNRSQQMHYLLVLVVISHAFNNLFHEMEHLQIIFKPYLEEKKENAGEINYGDLKNWLSGATPDSLVKVALAVIKLYL